MNSTLLFNFVPKHVTERMENNFRKSTFHLRNHEVGWLSAVRNTSMHAMCLLVMTSYKIRFLISQFSVLSYLVRSHEYPFWCKFLQETWLNGDINNGAERNGFSHGERPVHNCHEAVVSLSISTISGDKTLRQPLHN